VSTAINNRRPHDEGPSNRGVDAGGWLRRRRLSANARDDSGAVAGDLHSPRPQIVEDHRTVAMPRRAASLVSRIPTGPDCRRHLLWGGSGGDGRLLPSRGVGGARPLHGSFPATPRSPTGETCDAALVAVYFEASNLAKLLKSISFSQNSECS
jgi:hypothetical protein